LCNEFRECFDEFGKVVDEVVGEAVGEAVLNETNEVNEVGAANEPEEAKNEEGDDSETLNDNQGGEGDNGGAGGDPGQDSESNWDYSNRKNGDDNRGDAPELLFSKREIPPCTMNATEDGAEGQQEQGVQVLGILVPRNVKRRDVCGVSREGS